MNIEAEMREAEEMARLQDWPRVIEKCRLVLSEVPGHAVAAGWLGRALAACGQHDAAIAHYRAALELWPDRLEWRCNLSVLLAAAGRHAEAIDEAGSVLVRDAAYGPALFSQATSLLTLGNHDAAAARLAECAAVMPGDARVHNNHGLALAAGGHLVEALAAYDEALRLNPSYERAFNNRATAFMRLHRYDRALVDLEHALAHNPRYTRALVNRGAALAALGSHEQSLASYRLAFPDPEALAAATDLLVQHLHRAEDAYVCARDLFRAAPDRDGVAGAYHAVSQATAHWEDYDSRTAAIAAGVLAGRRPATPFRFLYVTDSPLHQRLCARGAAADGAAPRALWSGERYGHDRIKVAYLSSDFYAHATAYLMAGLFEHHDRSRFECFALSYGKPPAEDAMRSRLRAAFEHFEDVDTLSAAALAERIRALEIDLLIDLKGYTGGSRIEVLRHRPAPVQVHYLGYPGTLGAPFVDYLIADRHVVPPEHSTFYDERIVRMPHAYQVTDDRRRIDDSGWNRSRAGLPETGLVFAALHQTYKLTPRVFAVWMRLLKRFSNSTLWLLDCEQPVRDRLGEYAAEHGIAAARLHFAPQLPQAEHLPRLALADVLLDTWPYGAHTTASDALWMGVPCIALSGHSFASRVSGSLLTAAGFPQLVGQSLADYEALLIDICGAPGRLVALRRSLEAAVRRSPLFDTRRFARALENAYRQMWERYQAGLEPIDIDARDLA